jgi:protein-S-isoprenylcysteine O-methyltransferase Ste14
MNNSNQDITIGGEPLSVREQSKVHWEVLSKLPIIFSWNIQRERKEEKKTSITASSIIFLLALSSFVFFNDPIGKYGFTVGILCVGLLIFFMSYIWGAADDYYEYHLTQQGIYYTHTQLVPEIVFKFVRGFSYFGILVCIVAGVILGPVIFFGAGVFALMSFGMTNITNMKDIGVHIFTGSYVITHEKNDNIVKLVGKPHENHNYTVVYINDKEFLLSWLKNNVNISEVKEVDRVSI